MRANEKASTVTSVLQLSSIDVFLLHLTRDTVLKISKPIFENWDELLESESSSEKKRPGNKNCAQNNLNLILRVSTVGQRTKTTTRDERVEVR